VFFQRKFYQLFCVFLVCIIARVYGVYYMKRKTYSDRIDDGMMSHCNTDSSLGQGCIDFYTATLYAVNKKKSLTGNQYKFWRQRSWESIRTVENIIDSMKTGEGIKSNDSPLFSVDSSLEKKVDYLLIKKGLSYLILFGFFHIA
jgi:hypothetical protein